MATLGSGINGPKAVWEGRDPLYGQSTALRNIAGLGLYTPAWMRAKYPDLPAVGAFDSETFEPEKWTQHCTTWRRSPTGCRTTRSGRPAGGGVHRRRHPRHRAGRAVFRSEGRTLDRATA